MYLKLSENLKWQSSDVDWCEENYVTSKYVVEYYNTISNIPFVLLPMMLMFLCRDYSRRISCDLNIICALLIIVGLSSAYFHTTLSLLGQLLDELAILWMDIAATALWLPLNYFPNCINHTRQSVKISMLTLCAVCTVLGCIVPVINMFGLMVFSFIICKVTYSEIHKSNSMVESRIGGRSVVLWLVGVTVWCLDKFACNSYISLHYPYLHALWHVTAAVASIPVIVFYSLIETRRTHPHENAQLMFWPSWGGELGMPYIAFPTNKHMNNNIKSS